MSSTNTETETLPPILSEEENADDGEITARGSQASSTSQTWGWVVVAASFYCVGVVGGVCNITGVLMDSLKQDFRGNVALISLTGLGSILSSSMSSSKSRSIPGLLQLPAICCFSFKRGGVVQSIPRDSDLDIS